MDLRVLTICWLVILLAPIAVTCGAVIYVDADSPGGDGASWAAAFRYLQDALAAADADDEIRVAQGTYVPDQNSLNPDGSGDRYAEFGLISGVSIRGGYAGYGELDPDARDVREFETILSGDLRENDLAETAIAEYATARSRAENSYNVVRANETDETAVLDGFTITSGQADGAFSYSGGGGIYNNRSHTTLVNCTFTRNWARLLGGAIRNKNGSSPVVVKCRFIGNGAHSSGGAMSNDFQGSTELINCFFTGNVSLSGNGGAIDADNTIELTNCTLSKNSGSNGGGIFIAHGGATLTNCILWGNSDEGGT
ncbi:MAG: right-handed parallel beta-helix repeat-containing protein, partial [Planctomycetota bacterium]